MSVQPCSECGGLFANLPRGVCAGCLDQREGEFREVRDWLRANRGAGIAAAADATGVDEGTIVRFIREGRIEVVNPTADPSLRRDLELDERRAELARKIGEAPRLGGSLRADLAPTRAAQTPAPSEHPERGMRTRRS